jgi:hypothetical protein
MIPKSAATSMSVLQQLQRQKQMLRKTLNHKMAVTKAAHPPAETSSEQRLSRVRLSKCGSPTLKSSASVIHQEEMNMKFQP